MTRPGVVFAFFLVTLSAAAQTVEQRKELCFACHGANGTSSIPLTPSLGGQPSFFVLAQLFVFREGRRDNAPMSAAAAGLKDAELQSLANQREDYLLKALRDYKKGVRTGYGNAVMPETVSGLSDSDLADAAHFLAQLRSGKR